MRVVASRVLPFGPMAASGERRGVLLALEDERGAIGIGEASPLPGYSPDDVAGVRRALDGVHARLAQVPDDASIDAWVEASVAPLAGDLDALPSARFALETALFDLAARRAGSSIAIALGGASTPEPIDVNALVEARGGAALAEAGRALDACGYRVVKVKVGRAPWERELDAVRALRLAAPGMEIRLDANGAWSIAEARRRLDELAPLGVAFVEQPVAPEALVELGPCAVAWAADESLRIPGMAARLLDTPCAVFVLKPAVLGGLIASRALARTAYARGVGVVVTHLLDGPVALAACAELALALPRPLACGLDGGERLAGWPEVDVPQRAEPARVTPSGRAGLGVAIALEGAT